MKISIQLQATASPYTPVDELPVSVQTIITNPHFVKAIGKLSDYDTSFKKVPHAGNFFKYEGIGNSSTKVSGFNIFVHADRTVINVTPKGKRMFDEQDKVYHIDKGYVGESHRLARALRSGISNMELDLKRLELTPRV